MGGLALVEGQSRAAQGEQDQGQTDLSTRRRRAIEPLRDRSHADPDQGQTDLSTRRKGGALGQIPRATPTRDRRICPRGARAAPWDRFVCP
jgi:hypothetical protein